MSLLINFILEVVIALGKTVKCYTLVIEIYILHNLYICDYVDKVEYPHQTFE